MKFATPVFVTALLAASAVPAAAQQAAAQQKSEQTAKQDPDAMVCKTIEVTGSRFPKKQCHTREQWAQMDSDAKTMMREFQARPIPCNANVSTTSGCVPVVGDPSGH
ncbi:MAG: hypothetical protein QM741_09355 [Rudaea sp.]|uniref:hypothetical protein n=1 Tax=Rudaea sp. TaxID=2136325 RepID=UPI0039E4A754